MTHLSSAFIRVDLLTATRGPIICSLITFPFSDEEFNMPTLVSKFWQKCGNIESINYNLSLIFIKSLNQSSIKPCLILHLILHLVACELEYRMSLQNFLQIFLFSFRCLLPLRQILGEKVIFIPYLCLSSGYQIINFDVWIMLTNASIWTFSSSWRAHAINNEDKLIM